MRNILLSASLAAIAVMTACSTMSAAPAGDIAIETISNRADLISGGDALVRLTLPAQADVSKAMLALNGRALSLSSLHPARDGKGWVTLISGLNDGVNRVALTYAGKTVGLDVTNHSNGGPIFSGPQIQPWTCLPGAIDSQCNRPT